MGSYQHANAPVASNKSQPMFEGHRALKIMFDVTNHVNTSLYTRTIDLIAGTSFHDLPEDVAILKLSEPFRTQWQENEDNFFTSAAGDAAAGEGKTHLLFWLLQQRVPMSTQTLVCAASGGHLDTVEWILECWGVQYFIREDMRLQPDIAGAIRAAVQSNQVKVLELLDKHDKLRPYLQQRHQTIAAKYGHTSMMEFLKTYDLEFGTIAADTAAKYGQLEVIIFLIDNHVWVTSIGVTAAAKNGFFNVVNYVYGAYNICTTGDAIDDVASNGHFKLVTWLLSPLYTGEVTPTARTMLACANYGKLSLMKKLHPVVQCTPAQWYEITTTAARNGFVKILKWCHQIQIAISFNACNIAASHAQLDCVKFLWDQNIKCTRSIMSILFANENPDTVAMREWLIAKQLTPPEQAASYAAKNGNIAGLKKLQELNIRIGSKTCADAARGGHMETVQWLCAQNVRLHPFTARNAAALQSSKLLEFVLNNSNEDIGAKSSLWVVENSYSSTECFKLLYKRGYIQYLDRHHLHEAVRASNHTLVRWLSNNGVSFDRDMYDLALKHKNRFILETIACTGVTQNNVSSGACCVVC